jgi:hypothetical protein
MATAQQPDPDDSPEREDRPWEQPGAVRRDCESHRGALLARASYAAAVFGIASLGTSPCAFGLGSESLRGEEALTVLVPLFCNGIAFLISLSVWFVARQDLHRMSKGVMDPAGRCQTAAAKRWAEGVVIVGLIPWIAVGVTALILILSTSPH